MRADAAAVAPAPHIAADVEARAARDAALTRVVAAAVLVIALVVRVVAARAYPNIFWPDEIFQTLEQAHRRVFGYGIVPWEFRVGARSWLFPGLLALIMRVTAWAGTGSAGYLSTIAVVLATLSISPVAAAFVWARRDGTTAGAMASAIVCAGWFELVFFAPKALAEVAAAHVLIASFLLADAGRTRSTARIAAAAALAALSVAMRVQLAPAAVTALAFWRPGARRGWTAVVSAFVLVLLLAGILDWITWSYPFESFVRAIRINLVEGKSRAFGVLPYWTYVTMVYRTWGWVLVLAAPLVVVGARSRPDLLAAAAAVLVSHSVVAHKEYRFIYPALALLCTLVGVGTGRVVSWVEQRAGPRCGWLICAAAIVLWTAASVARGRAFNSRDTETYALQPRGARSSHWRWLASTLQAFDALGSDRDVCGIGLLDIGWAFTGGYVHLHRNVPIYELWSGEDYRRHAGAFNATVAHVRPGGPLDARDAIRCWQDGVCLFRRRVGGCRRELGYDINRRLVEWGQ